jgi:hypothetical protein
MWASEAARSAAIRELLAPHPALARLWTDEGPTRVACDYVKHGSPLSSAEHLLLQVAFDLWNGMGKAKVDDLLCTLDSRNLRAVVAALLARDAGDARPPTPSPTPET